VITVRFGYLLDEVRNPEVFGEDTIIATKEVDPEQVDVEQLRAGLQEWAVERLAERDYDFGLYTAEFGSWRSDGRAAYYLRQLCLVWSGSEVLAVHVDDSKVNFAGVRALTRQAEAFESTRS
jgi:hypothetical protein